MTTSSAAQPGIYVEILIGQPAGEPILDRVWQLTQQPDLHQRWDLRFTDIHYLPRPDPAEPQRFLYQTRIGFGLAISGTGASSGHRSRDSGDTTSSLLFDSEDPKSLIRHGSGYWRYIPSANGLRFLTWYDYQVRFGPVGRLVDRLAFRPLIGWATAWSFDRLRLWAELGQTPETSLSLSVIHALARLSLALVWVWHGLVPKLLFRNLDERVMLAQSGLPLRALPFLGAAEIAFGLLLLLTWRLRTIFLVNALLMLAATLAVAIASPQYLQAAFNPVTLNGSVFALSLIGWLASQNLPSARRCLRQDPHRTPIPSTAFRPPA